MMSALASLLGGANGDDVMSPESLLDLTCTLSREITPPPPTPAGPPEIPSLTADQGTAVKSLLKLLLRYRQGQSLGGSNDAESGGGSGGSTGAAASLALDSALSASLGDLAQACAPYVTQLGAEGAADLVAACTEFSVNLPWSVMKVSLRVQHIVLLLAVTFGKERIRSAS